MIMMMACKLLVRALLACDRPFSQLGMDEGPRCVLNHVCDAVGFGSERLACSCAACVLR